MAVVRICLADGSINSMCTSRVSVVPALAAALPEIDLGAANHHLDGEHYPYLLRVASAYDWTSMVGSWVDHGGGIRSRSSWRYNHLAAPTFATSNSPMLNELGGVDGSGRRAASVHFTEEGTP